jgi:hypothetical protein
MPGFVAAAARSLSMMRRVSSATQARMSFWKGLMTAQRKLWIVETCASGVSARSE